MYFCNKILRRSHRFGSRTREPNGDGTSIGRRTVSRHLPRAARTASPAGDPHRWAQPPSSWGTATACLPPTRFTITTTTPKPRRPSASETCTSHPAHRAEHDTVPTNDPSPCSTWRELTVYIRNTLKFCDSSCLVCTTQL